jgi:hypothetical protein
VRTRYTLVIREFTNRVQSTAFLAKVHSKQKKDRQSKGGLCRKFGLFPYVLSLQNLSLPPHASADCPLHDCFCNSRVSSEIISNTFNLEEEMSYVSIVTCRGGL